MKIKTKLRLGFGFLFLVILIFGGMSMYFMNQISESAKVVLKDNYESLRYSAKMRAILEDHNLPLTAVAEKEFNKQLVLEENNITEPGEKKAAQMLRMAFITFSNPLSTQADQQQALKNARLLLRSIDDLNMSAIVRKNDDAQYGVEKAATYLMFTACMCFLILFSFVVNFPGFVANPLREFSAALKEISQKNYKQRLEFQGSDEFSELAEEFNLMSAQLNKWENSNLAKLQSEKLRMEAIIEQMQDAIIGLNEKNEVLFLNTVAAQLLNVNGKEVIGADAMKLMKKNDLLKKIIQVSDGDKPMKIYADKKGS